jgi:hypothetical protein
MASLRKNYLNLKSHPGIIGYSLDNTTENYIRVARHHLVLSAHDWPHRRTLMEV